MINLPDVTLVCIDCVNKISAMRAIIESRLSINFGETVYISDVGISSKQEYSKFVINELNDYINTSHCLIIQYDGYVINSGLWNDDWLNYDYIGAKWWYDSYNVGNGGFSLRSKKLLQAIQEINPTIFHPEDDVICRGNRDLLESKYNIKFASNEIAEIFSFEPNIKDSNFRNNTFGFHGIPKLIL